VISAPLILGLDVTDDAKLTPILDIIGNQRALAVNQQWAGHPGMLVENIVPPPQSFQPGGVVVPSASTGDFNTAGGATVGGARPDAKTSGENIRSGNPGTRCIPTFQISALMIYLTQRDGHRWNWHCAHRQRTGGQRPQLVGDPHELPLRCWLYTQRRAAQGSSSRQAGSLGSEDIEGSRHCFETFVAKWF
jgi:hypothetical protein